MRTFVVAAVCAVVFGFLARPLLENSVPVESDLGKYHLPLRAFYHRCLSDGDSPSWCPDLFCGYHLHGEGQGGFAHPWHRWLYSTWPLTVAFNLEVFVSYPLMLAGAFLFLRRHRFASDAALAGAATFTFSGFCLAHYPHTNTIAIVAHMPWLLWLVDVMWTTESRRRMALAHLGISLLTGSQILLGYPQYVWFSALAEGMYVVALWYGDPRWDRLAWWLAAKGLGVGIGGAQLLPSLEALRLSPRMGYTREFRGTLSLPPAMGTQAVAPTLFNEFSQAHEYTVYAGALATLGLLWMLVRERRCGTPGVLVRWAVPLALTSVVLSLGRFTPFFRIYLKLPVIGVFRAPCRHLVLLHLAAGVLVACVVRDLRGGPRVPGRRLAWLALIPVVACGLAWYHPDLGDDARPFLAEPSRAWWGAGVLTAATVLLALAYRGFPGALTALVVLSIADLGYYGIRVLPAYKFVSWDEYLARQLRPPGAITGRIDVEDVDGNAATILGYSLTRGYVGLTPPRAHDYHSGDVLARAGTEWMWRDGRWNHLPAEPRIRFSGRGKVNEFTIRPGRITVHVQCEEPETLQILESWHPGWQAAVDGVPASVDRYESDFQAVAIPAGSREVVLRFDPASERHGNYLTWACLGLAVAAAFAVRPQ